MGRGIKAEGHSHSANQCEICRLDALGNSTTTCAKEIGRHFHHSRPLDRSTCFGPQPAPTSMIKHIPTYSVVLALLVGSIFSVMLSGFGPLAAELSAGSIGGALVAALIVSWLGAVFLQARWLAPVLFSSPFAVGLLFAVLSRHWGRCIALFACIVVPFVVVGFLGIDRRRIANRGA